MNELFPVEEVLSPRLAWMKEQDLTLHHSDCGDYEWAAVQLHPSHRGRDVALVLFDECLYYELNGYVGYGATEDEAIANFAKNRGIRLWNEQPAPAKA